MHPALSSPLRWSPMLSRHFVGGADDDSPGSSSYAAWRRMAQLLLSPWKSQTLTLLVSDRYNRGAEYGAYALSTLLIGVAVLVLIFQVVLDARRARATK